MANVDKLFNDMLSAKEAPIEKTAEQIEAEQKLEILSKYAEAAESALAKAGEEFNEDDVVKLASKMIEHDAQVEAEQAELAHIEKIGSAMADAFYARLNDITNK